MNKLKSKNRIPEAPESNAGDNFHVLWVVKKSFNLLNFDVDGLKAITVEGIDHKTSSKLDATGRNFLGIDTAEYYGNEQFKDASKVVISQLKYSSRNLSDNWTFSGLYKGRKTGSNDGSVFHRLALSYITLVNEFGRESVLEKLSIKFISNREFSPSQKQDILSIQDTLRKKPEKTPTSFLYRKFPKKKEMLQKVRSATKLNSTEFTDFLRLLNLDDCGTESSNFQEIKIIEAISELGIQNLRHSDALYTMVFNKMLPEAVDNGKNIITEIDLLSKFGMSMEGLFPVAQKFEQIENIVPRIQTSQIIEAIENHTSKTPICIHGAAGIGKSTMSQLIKQHISNNSEVILFDCYGEGSYLNPSDQRQLHSEALLQVSNEIAKRIGTPFLLRNEKASHILIREFKARVNSALEILKKRNPKSLLILLIDAADNSITAAEHFGNSSFIHDLLDEDFPSEFKLVVTSRSHRVSALRLPEEHLEIPLEEFSFSETKSHLNTYMEDSTDEDALEFHKLTKGIPRVQSYVLDLKKEGINEVINYLKPNGKEVKDLIQARIDEASIKLGDKKKSIVNDFFLNLISLPRPVPLKYLKKIINQNESLLLDLATDIWHGIIYDDNSSTISFRDEDFENFIRDKYVPTDEDFNIHARLFLERADRDDYASINLGPVLYKANLGDKLTDIVLDNQYLSHPADPIRQKEIEVDRIKLAMKLGSFEENKLKFFKLIFIAAEACKTDEALNQLLIQNFDLLASYGEIETVERIQIRKGDSSWIGSFHLGVAAIFSRDDDRKSIAENHLNSAKKWLSWKQRSEDDTYRITFKDIALGAEAHLRLFGSQRAINWLSMWSPKESVFQSSILFLESILKYSSDEEILKWLSTSKMSKLSKLIVLHKIKGIDVSFVDFNEMANYLLKAMQSGIKFESYLYPAILTFCEKYVIHSLSTSDHSSVIQILKGIEIRLPSGVPTLMSRYSDFYDDEKLQVESVLRRECLLSKLENSKLTVSDLHPDEYSKIEETENVKIKDALEREINKFDRFYGHVLAIYKLRASIIIGSGQSENTKHFEQICNNVSRNWELRHYDGPWSQYRLAFLASELVPVIENLDDKRKFIKLVIESFQDNNPIPLRINIVRTLADYEAFEKELYWLLDEIHSLIQKSSLNASEKTEFYIDCASTIRHLDKSTSRFYFEQAVESVSEIDIEAFDQIKCLFELSQHGISTQNERLAFEFARFAEFSHSRLTGYDNFPFEETVKGVANLDCASSFSIICRWDHRKFIEIGEHILKVLNISLAKGFVTPEIGGSMLPLNWYYFDEYVSYIQSLLKTYEEAGNLEQRDLFLSYLYKDVQFNYSTSASGGTVERVYELIKGLTSVDEELLSKIEVYNDFVNQVNPKDEIKLNRNGISIKNNNSKIEVSNKILEDTDFSSASSIIKAINIITSDNQSHYAHNQVSEFLKQITEACKPIEYVDHLHAFIELDTETLSFNLIEKGLRDRLESWSFHPSVRNWKDQNFSRVLNLWFSNFYFNDYLSYRTLDDFRSMFSKNQSELAKAILDILPNRLEDLSSRGYYETISFLGSELSREENEELVGWVLSRWNENIDEGFADGNWNEGLRVKKDSKFVIAKTLRYILGHPDKRIRWRGIHALRMLVSGGDLEVLREMIIVQNESHCRPFQHSNYTYYWISSKLYLWVCIARIAEERPQELLRLKDIIIPELNYNVLPHAQIKFFFKQTCQKLIAEKGTSFSKQEIESISKLLISKYKPVKQQGIQRKQFSYKTRQSKNRYHFDSMDTLPYWYGPLGSCFGLSSDEVAEIAEKFIVDKWKFKGNPNKENHVVTSSNEEYHLTQNRHGDMPVVEVLSTYYEYHAMFCAAGHLIENHPLVDNDYYSWDEWLESKTLFWNNHWLSDVRDLVPLNDLFWISEFDKYDHAWKDIVTDQQYDKIMGFVSETTPKRIKVKGDFIRNFGEHNEKTTISSALVSTKTSNALLRALQSSESNWDYILPDEGDDRQINKKNFQMIGWIKEIQSQNSGLDRDDIFGIKMCEFLFQLGHEVSKLFNLEFVNNGKIAKYQNEVISELTTWNDSTGYRSYKELSSEGRVLEIGTSFLLKFLKKRKMSLMVECEVKRHVANEESEFGTSRLKNDAKLYLINPDGTVKTIRGRNYKIG